MKNLFWLVATVALGLYVADKVGVDLPDVSNWREWVKRDPVEPKPIPRPEPPIPGAGFKVLVIEETSERVELPPSQLSVLTSATIRIWLTDNGAEARFWDADVDTAHEVEPWKSAITLPRGALPWVFVSNGTSGYSGPLPATVEEMLALLEKYKP